jgi:hypothetical protein
MLELAALVSALQACFSTLLAIVAIVLVAFCSASLAKFSANATKIFGAFAAKAHQLCCAVAKRCTLHAQADAGCEWLDVSLLSTRGCTIVAGRSRTQTCFNTQLVRKEIGTHKHKGF